MVGNATFCKQLESYGSKVASPPLPLTHMTDFQTFLGISREAAFAPKHECKQYKEFLLYSFYGRPAYRFKDDGFTFRQPSYAPVCFLLNPKIIPTAKRILPFDSGAFASYSPTFPKTWARDLFELVIGYDDAGKVVSTFWGGNREYYDVEHRLGLTFSPVDEKLAHYYELISRSAAEKVDQRCSTVEVQISAPLPLKGNIIAVLLPSTVATQEVRDSIKEIGASIFTYRFSATPYRRSDYYKHIEQEVRDWLAHGGLL